MDILHDPHNTIDGFGLVNLGASCWQNSYIQMLVSNTAFIDCLDSAQENVNPFIEAIAMLLCREYRARAALALFRAMSSRIGCGQQDAEEGLTKLIDLLSTKTNISDLFNVKYKVIIHCRSCGKQSSGDENSYNSDISHIVKIHESDYANRSLSETIACHTSELEDYKCGCGAKNQTEIIRKLKYAPSIIIVVFEKYDRKIELPFTNELVFNSKKPKPIKYKLTAQVEHVGGRNVGHYYTICARKNGVCQINDAYITTSSFHPTPNTYMLSYARVQ